ncbi:hypothetical protein KIN20_026497, partial [Parelaphostrongylus tenuis]
MVYTDKPELFAQVPGIATSKRGAQAFVERLVMQTWKTHFLDFEVLENQARSAVLPAAVISAILRQLTVSITLAPMPCQK